MEASIIKFRKLQYRPDKSLQLRKVLKKILVREKHIWFAYSIFEAKADKVSVSRIKLFTRKNTYLSPYIPYRHI